DGYYEGPELRSNEKNEYPIGVKVEGGKYEVEVYSPDNMGKYVLAVGTIESFPLNEIINTVKTMPKLKSGFFEKSSLTAFNNKIGMFIFGPAIILLLLIGVIIYLMKRKK
ncbi:hypothetical protein KKF04_02755, partial [Patescibacteria group bacterium]|nr:hypothetical protein [Patescibacteria group bacterium]